MNFRYGRPGDIDLNGETQFRNGSHNLVDVTVGVAFHQTR